MSTDNSGIQNSNRVEGTTERATSDKPSLKNRFKNLRKKKHLDKNGHVTHWSVGK